MALRAGEIAKELGAISVEATDGQLLDGRKALRSGDSGLTPIRNETVANDAMDQQKRSDRSLLQHLRQQSVLKKSDMQQTQSVKCF